LFATSPIDVFVLIGYFVLVFAIAGYVTIKEKVSQNSSSYFLGGRNVGWFIIGASLFASNIGSEHLVGLAGSGASTGVAVAQFEILASFALLLLGWVFVPFYIKSGVFTMPEFLEKRYDSKSRNYLSVISIIAYVLTKISVTIAAGGIVFEAIGVNFWVGAVTVVVVTGLYTVLGGLKAVLYTDMLQMFILIGGAVAVSLFGLSAIGGWTELKAAVEPSHFDMWLPSSHPDFPWTGILFGAPILGIWYWCTDQFIVQRVLAAKDVESARKGTIFAAFLKILPLFIFVVPGVIAYALLTQGKLEMENNDMALVAMIRTLLPAGFRGLVVAGLLAALMSSLSSVFNSCSTLITMDIYKRIKPEASEERLVRVGQMATGLLVVFGLAWIPLMKLISGQLYTYLQSVQAYIAPPITAVFLLGLLYKRLNARGAIVSLWSGFVLGFGRLFLELNKDSLSGALYYIADINFLHFAIILFVICSLILIGVSLATAAPDYEKIKDLTFSKKGLGINVGKVNRDRILTMIVLVIIAILWIYFS